MAYSYVWISATTSRTRFTKKLNIPQLGGFFFLLTGSLLFGCSPSRRALRRHPGYRLPYRLPYRDPYNLP